MPTRTISLRDEAYQRLRRARLSPRESFSDVVMRAEWPSSTLTAGSLLALVQQRGPVFDTGELRRIEELTTRNPRATDKWPTG